MVVESLAWTKCFERNGGAAHHRRPLLMLLCVCVREECCGLHASSSPAPPCPLLIPNHQPLMKNIQHMAAECDSDREREECHHSTFWTDVKSINVAYLPSGASYCTYSSQLMRNNSRHIFCAFTLFWCFKVLLSCWTVVENHKDHRAHSLTAQAAVIIEQIRLLKKTKALFLDIPALHKVKPVHT